MKHAPYITKVAIMTRTRQHMTISGSLPRTPRTGLLFRLGQMFALWQQRRRLAHLDEAALRDIGLTRTEAQTEAERPLWDVPANWLR